MPFEIDSAAKRARLEPRKNPYWVAIAGGRGGLSLGYRRRRAGAGAWVAKIVLGGKRLEERIGLADDPPVVPGAINYRAAIASALDWSVRQQSILETSEGGHHRKPTVRIAVEEYVKVRIVRSKRDGRICEGRLKKHVLSDKAFSDLRLTKFRVAAAEEWRARLPMACDAGDEPNERGLTPASINRLLNDLRAALNRAGVKYRRELPASFGQEVKLGTKLLEATSQARRQLLTDEQVRSVVEAAFEVDETGDFGRLALMLASTGARHSQASALSVVDLQVLASRVMMPGSRKGRSRKQRPPVPVPLAPDVVGRLAAAIGGRGLTDPLLMRWHHRKVGNAWEPSERRPWGPAYETEKLWQAAVAHAGLPPGTVMYALRHSSIVRGLRAMMPVRLVAALHDTSVEMVEQHYAAFILDVTEDLARRGAISFVSEVPAQLRAVA